ncbi:MAG: peptidylprolyl isomerase [Verrucomicrobiales bacterium]|nr:peptidylprolyl isomerase [Verrucomicrobiales bacterium]
MAFIINGETVSDDVIEEEFESIKEHYINAGEAVCCDRDEEFHKYARENVINRVLLEQASIEKFGEASDAEVDAKFQTIISEHGGEDAFYDNTGFNRGDEFMLRRKVKSSIMVDRFLEEQIGEESDPTADELKAFYEENIENYMTGVEVEVSQLFIEPNSHEAAKEVYDELYLARKEMLNGADFMELAKNHSGLESDEIKMGFIQQGQNMPEIDAIVFSMQPGEISPILATPFGFHLFHVTARNEPKPVPMEEIPNLEATFLARRREDRINAIIDGLKEKGTIEEVEEPQAV